MRLIHSIALLAALAVPTISHATTIIISDDFSGTRAPGLGENGSIGGAIDAYFTTVGNTNVDALSPGVFGSLCTAGSYCIDLNGTQSGQGYATDGGTGAPTDSPNGSNQGIFQTSNQVAPGKYILEFNLTGSGRNNTTSTTVTFGDYSHTFTLASGQVVKPIVSVNVTGVGEDGYLTFTSLQDGSAGSLLNTVNVATAPEPSSIALLGTGILGLAGLARKKFNV